MNDTPFAPSSVMFIVVLCDSSPAFMSIFFTMANGVNGSGAWRSPVTCVSIVLVVVFRFEYIWRLVGRYPRLQASEDRVAFPWRFAASSPLFTTRSSKVVYDMFPVGGCDGMTIGIIIEAFIMPGIIGPPGMPGMGIGIVVLAMSVRLSWYSSIIDTTGLVAVGGTRVRLFVRFRYETR